MDFEGAPPPMVGSFGGADFGVLSDDSAMTADLPPEPRQHQVPVDGPSPQALPQLPPYDPTPPRAPAVRAGPRSAAPLPPPPPVLPPGYTYQGPMPMQYGMPGPPPMHAMRGFGDDTPASSSNLLGLALLAVPVGGYVGSRYAGLLGAVGGALGAGAAVNSVRAARNFWGEQGPDAKGEAMVSATYAVLGFAVAGYLLYRGHASAHAKKNEASPNRSSTRPAPSRKSWL